MAATKTFVKLEGLPELNARLDKLSKDLQKEVLVGAMRKALDKAKSEAQGRAPLAVAPPYAAKGGKYKGKDHPGYLKKAFRVQRVRQKSPFLIEVQLQNNAYYALWVEYGHRLVRGGSARKGRRNQKGSYWAHILPQPFMRPTFQSQKEYMLSEVQVALQRRLKKRGV